MSFPLPTFAFYLVIVSPLAVRAQLSAPNCTDSTLAWSFNSLQQNPCWIVAYLMAVCNNGAFVVPGLLPHNSYSGPSGSDDSDMCKCNTVAYNLISACDACQGESWIPYSDWSFNCTTVATPATFPNPVPIGTRVPKWAYIDTSIDNFWNISAAQAVVDVDFPEVTGTASIVTISTVSQSTLTPSASGSGSLPTSTSHTSSNRGGIEGGVIGGVVGGTLISGVVVWFVRRRRARCAPSTTDTRGETEQPVPYPPETPKLYDPSDPTTYPRIEFQPQRFGFTSHLQPSQPEYKGLPEV